MKHSYVDKSILNAKQNCLHSCDLSVLSKYNQFFFYMYLTHNIQGADRQLTIAIIFITIILVTLY